MSEATQSCGPSQGRTRCIGFMLGMLVLATPAGAALPDYTLQLQARTNLIGNDSGAYNVAPGNLIAGSLQVPIARDRQVAFRLSITPEGSSAVWWGQDGRGSRIYLLPHFGEDARTGDPGINSLGDIAFGVAGASDPVNNGLYLLNAQKPSEVRIFHEPLGATDWQNLWLNEAGQLGFRALISGNRVYGLMTPSGTGFQTVLLAKEKALDPSSPYEFLYAPTLNDKGQIAGVADVAAISTEYFQELRVFNADGTSTLIARSRGLDAASPIYRFASVQPALNNPGKIAFLGTVRDPTGKNLLTLWLWTGTELRVLAQNGSGDIRELESFPPDINDSGLVVFRAFDSTGKRAVWVSDGQALKRVVTEHDIIPSDLGPARVDQETPSSPVFAGGPLINARGDVSVVAGLAPPDNDQEEWGTAIYVAQAAFPPGEPDGGVDGGSPETPDAGVDGGSSEMPDASVDGGSGDVPDSGTQTDGGTSGETPDGGDSEPLPPGDKADSGCGCQTAPTAALWPLLLLGLARYLSARRRGAVDRG
ncbi:MXAN_5453 family MXYO-CTERM-anchored protein [Hyalangium versicolor]|uniref:MXAN_5453 family MXYO-CTERM-anchored protein n=1 Tax=Hyalangium versicolor TaxID=2861190 RepID=UPI001CCE490A|nr:MXAN_5453 family MXYO-CTERM-anchored protein [Hyalangium versicolor]